MTNPPPQYANEQGGVINIVTKKGKVGRTGRLNLSAGTRGDVSVNASYTYRKQGLALAVNAGTGYSRFAGNGYSVRENFYADSSNFFNTKSDNSSRSIRTNLRVNLDYDLDKFQSLNAVFQLNPADQLSSSRTGYRNINRFGDTYRLSERTIHNAGNTYNGLVSLSYLLKTKKPGEQLRIILSANLSTSHSDRDFFQQFFNPDHTPNGIDSTQEQLNKNKNGGYHARADFTKPLRNKRTILSVNSYYTRNSSYIITDASYFSKG
jgi:hypothetical protein